MSTKSDAQLLREYAGSRSEAAFAELVRRHLDLVYSAALRITGDAHLAKDVSQGVFVALAKDAGKLAAHPVLSGWLHATTRNIAAQTIRTEARRRKREQQAAAMNDSSETHAAWDEIAPHLDAALSELAASDRDAVLLRYFENQSAKDMAAVLGISAEAAQKRVNRGLEKLRDNFAKRGITAGAAGLTGAISANAVQAAPAGLAAMISSTAFAGTAGIILTTKTLAMTALQKSLVAAAISFSLGVAVFQSNRAAKLDEEVRRLRAASLRLSSEASAGSNEPLQRSKDGKRLDERMVARLAQQKTEEMREAGMLAKKNAPNYLLIGGDGRITQQAMREAGITRAEADAVQKLVDDKWREVSKRLASVAHLDERASQPESGLFVYDIPSLPDGGAEYVRQLEEGIHKIAGKESGRVLIDAFDPNNYLCGFGKYDVRVELMINEGEGNTKDARAKYSFTYPKTSQIVRKGSMHQQLFSEEFGSIFEELGFEW